MMKNLSSWASVLLVVFLATSEARAQYGPYGPPGSMSLRAAYRRGYDANVTWPSQFVPAARQGIYSTYAAIVNNGWRRQNLLGDYHFNPDTNELTQAGQLKVKWILTQAPAHRRSIFVQRAANQAETASRVASVHGWASKMSPAVGPVDVNDTHIVAEGHPAGAVDNMFVGFQKNQPPPVLPAVSNASDSAGN